MNVQRLVLASCVAALTAAPALAAVPPPVCGRPGGIQHVSTAPASCCVTLPCHRPVAVGTAPKIRTRGRA
jgi:hypothetical protein